MSAQRREILVFSKYFGYNVGGAERSMVEMLREEEKKGRSVRVVRCERLHTYAAHCRVMQLPDSWSVEPFELPWDMVRFRYLAYALNRKAIARHFAQRAAESELYAYGHYAPAAILAYPGPSVYIVRDEYGVGWDENYDTGWRKLWRAGYQAIETPWRSSWRRDLRAAVRKSRLIANSRFMAAELRKIAPDAQVEVVYPMVDCAAIRREYEQVPQGAVDTRGVIMVGNTILKGTDVFLRVAASLPAETFYVFDRAFEEPVRRGNVVFMPWQMSIGAMYAFAKIVLMPSRWAEAFGRVVVEAQCLGIPVVASARGGIPEAMHDPENLVYELENIDEWRAKLKKFL